MNFNPNKKSSVPKILLEKYNFEEIKEIRDAMIDIVFQLKSKIDKGEYSNIISDETGGRIPTLIIKDVIFRVNPDKKINPIFLNAGGDIDFEKTKEFIESKIDNSGETLICTEYIRNGSMITKICDILKSCEVKKIDIACLCVSDDFSSKNKSELLSHEGINNFYTQDDDKHLDFSEKHTPLSLLALDDSKEESEEKKKLKSDIKMMSDKILELVWNK